MPLTRLEDEPGAPRAPERRTLVLAALGGLAAASALGALVFTLGGWAYRHRRFTLHDGRLQRVLKERPTADQVSRALLAEAGNQAIETPSSEEALHALARGVSPRRAQEVVEKRRRWPGLRIFGVGDMVYFLYFDEAGILRDYVLLP